MALAVIIVNHETGAIVPFFNRDGPSWFLASLWRVC